MAYSWFLVIWGSQIRLGPRSAYILRKQTKSENVMPQPPEWTPITQDPSPSLPASHPWPRVISQGCPHHLTMPLLRLKRCLKCEPSPSSCFCSVPCILASPPVVAPASHILSNMGRLAFSFSILSQCIFLYHNVTQVMETSLGSPESASDITAGANGLLQRCHEVFGGREANQGLCFTTVIRKDTTCVISTQREMLSIQETDTYREEEQISISCSCHLREFILLDIN